MPMLPWFTAGNVCKKSQHQKTDEILIKANKILNNPVFEKVLFAVNQLPNLVSVTSRKSSKCHSRSPYRRFNFIVQVPFSWTHSILWLRLSDGRWWYSISPWGEPGNHMLNLKQKEPVQKTEHTGQQWKQVITDYPYLLLLSGGDL